MKKEKFTLPMMKTDHPFFPSPHEVVVFLCGEYSPRRVIGFLSQIMDIKIRASERTLDHLNKEGISPKLAYRIFIPFWRKIRQLGVIFSLREIVPEFYARGKEAKYHQADVKLLWDAVLYVMTISYERGYKSVLGENSEIEVKGVGKFVPWLNCFIGERAEALAAILNYVENAPEINQLNQPGFLLAYYQLALPYTRLTEDEQQRLIAIFKENRFSLPEFEMSLTVEEIEVMVLFTFDFYLSFFAIVDHMFAASFKESYEDDGSVVPEDAALITHGILHEIFSCEGKTYFDRMITFIKNNQGTTYKHLAQFVPVNSKNKSSEKKSGRTREEAQVETLKKWRAGKTKPTIQTMSDFFAALGDHDFAIYGVICQAIDRLVEKSASDLEREMVENVFSATYYLRHFQYWCKVRAAVQQP